MRYFGACRLLIVTGNLVWHEGNSGARYPRKQTASIYLYPATEVLNVDQHLTSLLDPRPAAAIAVQQLHHNASGYDELVMESEPVAYSPSSSEDFLGAQSHDPFDIVNFTLEYLIST